MIKKLWLFNFFSFKGTGLELHPKVNVLVGINGSGKSNVFKALSLLKEGIDGIGLKKLIYNEWGGFDAVRFLGEENESILLSYAFDSQSIRRYLHQFTHDVDYEIQLRRVQGGANYFVRETLRQFQDGHPDSPDLMYTAGGDVYGKTKSGGSNGADAEIKFTQFATVDPQELALAKIYDTERFSEVNAVRRAIEDIVIYRPFDTSPQGAMRKPVIATSEKRLLGDGSNLVQTLNTININHKGGIRTIREKLRDINPKFKGIDFNFLGGSIELLLEEEGLSKSVHVSHISDGTLRLLCLLAICYNPDRGKLICIDEPELGLHPDMIPMVAQAIRDASEETQFIISTHSPHLLDYFDLDHIRVCEKNAENASDVLSLSEAQFKGWYEERFNPGQMWRAGDYGGNRW